MEENNIVPESRAVPETADEPAAAVDLKEAKRGFSRLGLGAFVILALGSLLQIFLAGVIDGYYGGAEAPAWMLWVVTFVPLYCAAVPAGLLIMRRTPAYPREGEAFGAGRFLKLLPICIFLMYAGNIVGTIVTSILGALKGGTVTNPLENYAMGGGPLAVKILVMVVLAPMIEEFIFRRVLIDRMRVYGEKLAVVTSALMFGLFHGNLSQFFYAFALGMLFGYIYVKTGRLRYSAALHMFVNCLGSVVAPALLERSGILELGELDPAGFAADPEALASMLTPGLIAFAVYALLLVVVSIIGLVLLLANAHRVAYAPAEREIPKEKRFATVWCNAGMGLLALACLGMIVFSVFS